MDLLIENFIDILSAEKAVHEELLKLAAKKKETLIKNKVDVLNDIVSKEIILVNNVKELEEKREAFSNEIAKELNITQGKITLDKIAKGVNGDLKQKLLEIKNELSTVVKKLADYNDLNKELIKTHLKYTYFSLNIMTQSGITADTYDNSGYVKEDNKARVGLVDQKV